MNIEYINVALKFLLVIVLVWGIVNVVDSLKGYQHKRYTYHQYGKVIDEQTGKVYDVRTKKLVFDPAKVR